MYIRKVFYYETDRMGIVHNSNYLRYFEEARLYYMEQIGADYHKMEENGILIPQSEAFVKYRTPISYGESIIVVPELKEFNGISMKFEYCIYTDTNKAPVTTGYTKHCFMDEGSRMPINLKKRAPQTHRILAEHCM